MEHLQMIRGFSELKDLLIQTYHINRPREHIRLHFTSNDTELLMHDFDDHNKVVWLVYDLQIKKINRRLTGNAKNLVLWAITFESPAQVLNDGFLGHGSFRFRSR